MKTLNGLLTLGAMLTVLSPAAEARPLHSNKTAAVAASTHRVSTDGFAARMGRLDALMGIKGASRARSAFAND